MPDRKSLVFTLWLISASTLLASVLAAPTGTSGFVAHSRVDSLHSDFVLPPHQPTTCLGAAMVTAAVLEVNALPSEDGEQDRFDALDEPRVSFLVPSSFHKISDRQSIVPRSILSHYPLRC